ncbi:ABC transporter substrate-binding protein [Nonomuraea sp. LPB2021202275-12-8]|uniref:ABC transporter substrate-binding protein n=1 Tax=Nonomuraea sp. LPB2021202275-12-8 TaxID=3120159 RepID=UPI00300D4330
MTGVRPLRPGDPVSAGSFRLASFLGEGGQGSVYLGTSPSGERVAIKLLHARFAEDASAVRRFRREAEAARRVAEFCTARVLEVGAVDGRPYIVSEYVDGPSLHWQVTSEGPLTGSALMRLAIATATALAAIHRAGVIHRDFKPSNVLLAPDGPRVIDFGIARALDVSQSLTTSVVGTPAFMAPEQFHGEAAATGDVFAWAGTMVYAATGRGAFGFGALPVLMHRILSGEPDLSGVPAELVPLLGAALGKDPRRRPTAEQVLRELIRAGTAPPPVQPSPQHSRAQAPAVPPPYRNQGPAPIQNHQRPAATFPQQNSGPQGFEPRAPARPGSSRRGLLVSAGAVATALVVGVTTWLVVQGIGTGSGRPTPTPSADAQPGLAVTATANPSTRRGGILRVASDLTLDSTDPGNAYTPDALNLIRLYGRSLTMFKPAPGAAGTQIVPDLAESLGVPGDGGKTWTYKLRQGVKFQDGTVITSRDVKHAVLRSMDSELAYGSSHFDSLLDLPADYRGPHESPGQDTDRAIETPDDRTIVFRLKEPFATFDHVVQLPETVPVPESADKRADYRHSVVSSGPYMIKAATDTRVTLVRNPHWDAAADPNRPALPDGFELTFAAAEAGDRLRSGQVEVGPPIGSDALSAIKGSRDLSGRVDQAPTSHVRFLAINPQVEPFDDVNCRRAVVQALSLAAVRGAYDDGIVENAIPTSLLPPLIPGRHPVNPDLQPAGDTALARASLARCGKPDGFPATYIHRDLPRESAAAEAVRAALARVGITVTLQSFPIGDFSQKYGGNPSYLKSAGVGLIARSWLPDWPDSESFLSLLVDSRLINERTFSANVSVRSAEVDELVDQARKELDATRRAELWTRIEQKVADQAVLVPLLWQSTPLLRGRAAANVHVSPVYGRYDLVTMGVR